MARKLQDRFVAGLPDVAYCVEGCAGWIEQKWLDRWPAREGTLVDVGLTAMQARWIEAWRAADGWAHVLLCVGSTQEWFLYNDADDVGPGKRSREALERRAAARGALGDLAPLLKALRDRPT
jgi:hypothetical protein